MRNNTSLPRSTRTLDPKEPDPVAPHSNETIVAVATPSGRGGVSIVRLSGPLAADVAKQLTGRLPVPRLASLASFRDAQDAVIDQGLMLFFPNPTSYTGEDVLELHAHGSPVTSMMLVRRCIELGARMARPGEFSERAFLSGQLDLAQAEAVADLIESSTESAARSAISSLRGEFSRQVHDLVDQVTHLRIYVEAAIDFPDEEIDFLADNEVTAQLAELKNTFTAMRASMQRGRLLREGLKVVLVGSPNAGKSSLMNQLGREQRAIVSDIPGTTRDTLEQQIEIEGLPVLLVDTAGLRESDDVIEAEGVKRAIAAQQEADLVLLISDGSTSDCTTNEFVQQRQDQQYLSVVNKIDLIAGRTAEREGDQISLSALTGEGIPLLLKAIIEKAGFADTEGSEFIARQRHIDALDRAQDHVWSGVEQLERFQAGELLAEELKLAQQALGEITGVVTSDDLLGLIFSSFCIGK